MKRAICSLIGHRITGRAYIKHTGKHVAYCSRCEREVAPEPPDDMPQLAPGWLNRSLDRAHRNILQRPEHLKPARYRRGAA